MDLANNYIEGDICMFQKKVTEKGLAALLLFSVMVSVIGGSSIANAAGKEKYKSSYLQFVKQQQKNSQKKLCYAIINASDGKMPVLLVARADFCVKGGKEGAVQASVYSYSDGKVVHITEMQSTGSGYPLLKKDKYIISGWHHSSQRLMVSGAKGYMDTVDGFGINGGKCHKKSWVVVNGKKQDVTSKVISEKKAAALDYYLNASEHGGKTIVFKKVK